MKPTTRRRAGSVSAKRTARVLQALALASILLLLSSCAAGPNPEVGAGANPPGFWLGLWHGLIVPVTFVISLFTDQVSVYEVANNGNWYDFGYVAGIVMALGGGGGASAGGRKSAKST